MLLSYPYNFTRILYVRKLPQKKNKKQITHRNRPAGIYLLIFQYPATVQIDCPLFPMRYLYIRIITLSAIGGLKTTLPVKQSFV